MLNDSYEIFVYLKGLAKKGKFKEAYNGYKKLLETEPGNEYITFELGRVEIKLRLYNDAKTHFESLLSTNRGKLATFELGKIAVILENYEEAKMHFKKLVDKFDDYYAKFELAKLESRTRNYDASETLFLELLKIRNDKAVKLELGIVRCKMHKFKLARENFLELALNGDPYGMMELGKLEASFGNNEEAKRWFYTLYNLDEKKSGSGFNVRKNQLFALFEVGRIEANDDNLLEARKIFQKLAYEFNDNYAKIELARIEAMLGNIDFARNTLNKLYFEKHDTYALIELVRLENNLMNFSECKKYLSEISRKKSDENVRLELARLHERQGNFEEAVKLYESLFGTKSEIYGLFGLVDLYISISEYEKSLFYLDKLTSTGKISPDLIKKYNFFLKFKLGIIENDHDNTYIYQQIMDYSVDKFIDHFNVFLKEDGRRIKNMEFNENINLEKLLQTINEKLNNSNRVITGMVDNYIVDTGEVVGSCYGIKTSKVKVKTLSNTLDIIMLTPILSPYINRLSSKKRSKKRLDN